jgi:hypothetical protein
MFVGVMCIKHSTASGLVRLVNEARRADMIVESISNGEKTPKG